MTPNSRKAQGAYVKNLWNGSYFNYDQGRPIHTNHGRATCRPSGTPTSLDLAIWFPRQCVSPRCSACSLQRNEVPERRMGASMAWGGRSGAARNEQVEEVWTGTTFCHRSHMLSEGIATRHSTRRAGLQRGVERSRYFFRTPEAYDARGMYRAACI